MNCKPGDMAIVIAAELTPEMIGRIVRVVRRVAYGEIIGSVRYTGDGAAWLIESDRPLPIRCTNGRIVHQLARSFGDRYIRPISGVPVHDEQHGEVPA